MPGFELLDVAISLVFLYLLLSLFCSSLSELVEAILRKRSANLLEGIKMMFNDPDGKAIVEQLYNQTLIFSLFKGDYDPNNPKNLPSYIKPETFTSALLGILVPVSQGPLDIAQIKGAIEKLPNGEVKKALCAVVNQSCDSVEQLKAGIDAWYQSSMERVTGWYKRHVQLVGLALGFALAVVFNADTLGVANGLARDRAMATAFVAVAQGYSQRSTGETANKDFNALLQDVQNTSTPIGLPIGWSARTIPSDASGWLIKLIGFFLTAVATTLGSSFWFDLLKNLFLIRGSVQPKEPKQN